MPRNAQWTAEEDQELTKLTMTNHEKNKGMIDWDEIVDQRTGQIARRSKNAMISRWWKIKEKQDYNINDDDEQNVERDAEEDEEPDELEPHRHGNSNSNSNTHDTLSHHHHSHHTSTAEQMSTANLYASNNGTVLSANGLLLSNALNSNANNALQPVSLSQPSPQSQSQPQPPSTCSPHLNSHLTPNGETSFDGKKKKKRKKKHSSSHSSKRSKSKSLSISNASASQTHTHSHSHSHSQSIPLHLERGAESVSHAHPKHGNASSSSSMQNIIHNLLSKKEGESASCKLNDSESSVHAMHAHGHGGKKYNFMEDTSEEDEAGAEQPDEAVLAGMNGGAGIHGKRRSSGHGQHGARSKAASTDAVNKRVTRSATRKQKSMQNKKKEKSAIANGGSERDLISHKNYYRHDIQTLQLTSFELTQIKPYIKAFSEQVLLNDCSPFIRSRPTGAAVHNASNHGNSNSDSNQENDDCGGDVEEERLQQVYAQNGNLRKTIVLQNRFLTELYTKVQHQQGIAREMVEKMDKLKEQSQWIKQQYKECKQRVESVHFDKDLYLKQMMEKDGMLSGLRTELNTIKTQYAQQLAEHQQQIQQQLQAQLESAHKEWTNAYTQINTEVETAKTALIATQSTLNQMQSVYIEHTNALIKVLNVVLPNKLDQIHHHIENIQSIQQIEHINQINQNSLNHFAKIVQFMYDLVQIFKLDAIIKKVDGNNSSNGNNNGGNVVVNNNGNSNLNMNVNDMIDTLQSKLYAALKPTVYGSHIEQFEKQKKQKQKQKQKSSSPKQMDSNTKTKQRKRKRPVTSSHGNELKMNDTLNANNNNNTALGNMNANENNNGNDVSNPRKKRKKNDLSLPMINGNSNNNNLNAMQPSQAQPQQMHAGKLASPQRQPPPPIFTPINTNNSTPNHSNPNLVNSANCATNNAVNNNVNPANSSNPNNNNAFTLQASDANWLTTINSNANHQTLMTQAQPFQAQFSLTGATLSGQYQPIMLQSAQQQQQQQQQHQHQHHQHLHQQQQQTQTQAGFPTQQQSLSQPPPQQQQQQQQLTNNPAAQNTNNHAKPSNNEQNNILPPSLSAHVPPPLPATTSTNRNPTTVPLPPRPPPPKLPNKPPRMTSMDRTLSAPATDNNRKSKKHSLTKSVSSTGSCSNNRVNYKAGIELLLQVALNDPEQQQKQTGNDRK